MQKELKLSLTRYLRFKIFNKPINIPYSTALKILIVDNDSGDRSIAVQDCENNDSGERSRISVSQERHRNEEKDFLANRKQESQSRVIKRKKKCRKRKVSTIGEDSDSSSTDSSSPAKKMKPNVIDIINRHRHLPQLLAIQVPMRNCIMAGLTLTQKMKNFNVNYGQLRKQIF